MLSTSLQEEVLVSVTMAENSSSASAGQPGNTHLALSLLNPGSVEDIDQPSFATHLSIPPPPFPEDPSVTPQAFPSALAATEGRPVGLDALLASLFQQHPQIAQDIGKCAATSLKFKYLQASAGVNKADIHKIWEELPRQEQQDLQHAFELGDGSRDDWFLAVVEEERLQRRRLERRSYGRLQC